MAPPVAVYVAAAVVGVAAVYVFKEYVYEPHLAPRFEAWAEEFLERRRAARSRRGSAVPVPSSRRRRDSTASSDVSHHENDVQEDLTEGHGAPGPNDFSLDGFELEALASKEVDEWRNAVLRSQERTKDGLRRRTNRPPRDEFDSLATTNTTLDESFTSLTQTPLAYVISNISSPATTGTVSLPQTPTRHLRSGSHSTTQGDGSTIFVAPQSPPSSIREAPTILPRTPSPVSADPMPHRPLDGVGHLDITSPTPLEIPNAVNHTPLIEAPPHPLPFTPTYQVMANDSPFGPLLPDTPRSSAEMYGERPFSPLTRVMGSSSGSASASARGGHPSRANSANSIRTLGSSGLLRKGSGLANELIMSGSDDDDDENDHPLASASTSALTNPGSAMNVSVVSSLSERYPAPPTPPVIVSPPTSALDVISAPSSPSSGSEIVIHVDPVVEASRSPPSQTYLSLPTLQLPRESPSPDAMSRSPSQAYSALSPALSYASFLSPMPMSRAVSGSEADEFMTVASDESDWGVSPVSPSGPAPRVVQDRAHNPFLDFEHLTHSSLVEGHGGSEHERNDDSEDGSDDSWGSARRH